MTTLHIEHPVVDFDLWNAAFDRFADVRHDAGVRSHRVSRPVDDPHYVIIDLAFDSAQQAQSFRTFLEQEIWSSSEKSPALAGTPQTVIFETDGSRATVNEGTTHR
jgi:hypothetical protein